MPNLDAALSDEKNRVRVWVERLGQEVFVDLDAAEVSAVIDRLGELRAQMTEEIPRRFETSPVLRNVEPDANFFCAMETPTAKVMVVGLRHSGLGWIAGTMDAKGAWDFSRTFASVAMRLPKPGGIIRV